MFRLARRKLGRDPGERRREEGAEEGRALERVVSFVKVSGYGARTMERGRKSGDDVVETTE